MKAISVQTARGSSYSNQPAWLMDEGVRLSVIDTPVPLTCFPIKLISFCQFIS